jgi:pullulanase/glycogen debranching enzyme
MPIAGKGFAMTTDLDRGDDAQRELHKGNTSPLGATVCNGGVNFSVFARDCTGIELLLFDAADDATASRTIPLDPRQNRTYTTGISSFPTSAQVSCTAFGFPDTLTRIGGSASTRTSY